MFECDIPHQKRVPTLVGSPVVREPVAGVLNPHVNDANGVGVGAEVGANDGGMVPPPAITIESIEMSPVKDVVRLAVHFTDETPKGNARKACVHACVTDVCCCPVWFHCDVHTVPTQVCTVSVPMVAPNMW
jgi:hypothetical protein